MNSATRIAVISLCALLCGGGILIAHAPRASAKIDNNEQSSGGIDQLNAYQLAASDAPQKLRFREIESIIRRDPSAKAQDSRIEFGSIKMERGAALVEVLFIEGDGATRAFLYKLVPDRTTWRVSSAHRLWFVPRTYLLRGVRA